MTELELYSTHRIRHRPEMLAKVRQAVIEHRFSKLSGWEEGGEERYAADIDRHAFKRHDSTVEYIVPWVNQSFPLEGKTIVEVGCGTGSSTAAFAKFSGHVFGYDIAGASVEGAKARLAAHGLADRATFCAAEPQALLKTIEERHREEKADVVLMFALLEHQTLAERLETLRIGQAVTKPGGVIVIAETPNRLTYFDHHTSQLPFFHMLPLDLQLLIAKESPRRDFRENIRLKIEECGDGDPPLEHLIRWGQSVSFHEFDLAFDNVDSRIIGSGDHPNIMRLRPPKSEEVALRSFMEETGIKRHPGFMRYFLDLIIRV
ncbi:MAG: class I SAM-dependent methyltransferase [Parvularculaceae bacterium]